VNGDLNLNTNSFCQSFLDNRKTPLTDLTVPATNQQLHKPTNQPTNAKPQRSPRHLAEGLQVSERLDRQMKQLGHRLRLGIFTTKNGPFLVDWWVPNPFEKYAQVQLDHFQR